MKVWEALFPNYYDTPAPEAVARGMTGIPYVLEGRTKLERAACMAATVGVSYGDFLQEDAGVADDDTPEDAEDIGDAEETEDADGAGTAGDAAGKESLYV